MLTAGAAELELEQRSRSGHGELGEVLVQPAELREELATRLNLVEEEERSPGIDGGSMRSQEDLAGALTGMKVPLRTRSPPPGTSFGHTFRLASPTT